jgi:hypothetical protein
MFPYLMPTRGCVPKLKQVEPDPGLVDTHMPHPGGLTAMSPKRPFFPWIRLRSYALPGLALIGALACGGGPTEPLLNPSFMVGEWLADSLVMTSSTNPETVLDLAAAGAVFTLSVQPSGRYTAILTGFGQSSSEAVKLTVDGDQVVLMPESPPAPESRAVWERLGESVVLVGDSDFDFNGDGTNEAASLRQVLIPK